MFGKSTVTFNARDKVYSKSRHELMFITIAGQSEGVG